MHNFGFNKYIDGAFKIDKQAIDDLKEMHDLCRSVMGEYIFKRVGVTDRTGLEKFKTEEKFSELDYRMQNHIDDFFVGRKFTLFFFNKAGWHFLQGF